MPALGHRVDGEILCSSQETWDFGGKRGWDGVGLGVGGRESSQSMRNFHRQAEEFGLNLIHPKEKKKKDFRTQGTEKSSTLE